MSNFIGRAYGLDRQELTVRIARSTSETQRDPRAWWEPNIKKGKPKPFKSTPPMRDAPIGAMAELQRVLLKKPGRDRRIDRVYWALAIIAITWLAVAAMKADQRACPPVPSDVRGDRAVHEYQVAAARAFPGRCRAPVSP